MNRLLPFYSLVLGLAVSSGYPVGAVLGTAMPLAVLAARSRMAAFLNSLMYYLGALWPVVSAIDRYFASIVLSCAAWVFGALVLSLPWTLAWTSRRIHYLWRAPLAILLTVIPPVGIVGLASPLLGAGYLFPGCGWFGLAATALIPAILLSSRDHRVRIAVLTAAACIAIVASIHASVPQPPAGWTAIDTHFGDLSRPFKDFRAAGSIQATVASSQARVIIFPESVVPEWTAATEAFWKSTLDRAKSRGQVIALGVGIPSANPHRHDFGEAIAALTSSNRVVIRPGRTESEQADNAVLIAGAESAIFRQRIPVPFGMWWPLSPSSVPLRPAGPGVIEFGGERAAILICYEQTIPFPVLASMLQRPTVLIGVSNTFWIGRTPVPRHQATAMRGWARLFDLPLLLAVNS